MLTEGESVHIKVEPKHRPRVVMTRENKRKQKRSILDFAKIFEEYKHSLASVRSEPVDFPADLTEKENIVYNFYNHRWKNYCRKWNSKRGNPELGVNLFSTECEKYLNELRTMPTDETAE